MHTFTQQRLCDSLTVQGAGVLAALSSKLRCPICGSPYDAEEMRLVRERDHTLTVAVQCHCCSTGALLSVRLDAPLQGELEPAERIFFAQRPPISPPEAARLRRIIREHTGSPAAL